IGKEQKENCMMLITIADQLGYIAVGKTVHVSFGHLTVDKRKMSSRQGGVVLLNDILNESKAVAEGLLTVRKQNKGQDISLTESDQMVAEQLGLGALIFNDLLQDRQNDIEFDPDLS